MGENSPVRLLHDGRARWTLHSLLNWLAPRYAVPQILVHPRLPFALMWSPKAGCTTVLKWALSHHGLLDRALGGPGWVHDYARRTLFRSPACPAVLTRADIAVLPVIKVTRHPADQLVSALAHAFRMRMIGGVSEISFRIFVDYLARIDLAACNAHFRTQTHPVERFGMVRNVEVVRPEDGLLG